MCGEVSHVCQSHPEHVSTLPALASSRIKDIAAFEGVRDDLLIGYGLVVGLNGTGDSLSEMAFTKESLIGRQERLGINIRDYRNTEMEAKNIAAVMVTGVLPGFARQGRPHGYQHQCSGRYEESKRWDVAGDAPDQGRWRGLCRGPGETIQVSGFTVAGKAANVTRNIPTAGRIPNGAIVEREISFALASPHKINIALRNPDFTTARCMAQAINAFVGTTAARVPAIPAR